MFLQDKKTVWSQVFKDVNWTLDLLIYLIFLEFLMLLLHPYNEGMQHIFQ